MAVGRRSDSCWLPVGWPLGAVFGLLKVEVVHCSRPNIEWLISIDSHDIRITTRNIGSWGQISEHGPCLISTDTFSFTQLSLNYLKQETRNEKTSGI